VGELSEFTFVRLILNREMQVVDKKILADFWVAGINYRKTEATIRGQFAINNEQYSRILAKAKAIGLSELFILSTCNRTEIYGFAPRVKDLIELLCSETAGSKKTFTELSYVRNGVAAAEHLFEVSAGLDSQVLGDYEIIGQVKQAAKLAKEQGFVGAFTERLLNCALQSSKAIKNNTQLSGGTVSVSFAAIQYIKEHVRNFRDKKILLLGVGKIGRNTCKNLVDYLETNNVTLINRTEEKARILAEEFGLKHAPVSETNNYIKNSDIIITATSCPKPLVTVEKVRGQQKLLIDLAIPYNIDPAVKELAGIDLLNVDELSKMKDETLMMRQAEVPKAKKIILEHVEEFLEWYEMRQNVPVLIALKKKLNQIESCPLVNQVIQPAAGGYYNEDRIQKVINTTAIKLKANNTRGCYYIQAINEFIAVS
jgi:glutamyl-tRNA reductase